MLQNFKFFFLFCLIFLMTGSIFAQSEARLSLDECVAIALENNSNLRNAERQVKIAETGVTTAWSYILPSVDVSLSTGTFSQGNTENLRDVPILGLDTLRYPVFDFQNQPIGTARTIQPTRILGYESKLTTQPSFDRDYNNFDFNMRQNVFDGGAWWNRIRQSKASLRASMYNHTATRQTVAREVIIYYYNLLKAIRLQDVYESAVQVAAEQLKRTESMYEIGSIALMDVYKARVTLGENQINLVTQKNAVRIAKMSLNTAMGRSPDTPLEVTDIQEIKLPDFTLENAIAIATEKNPELQYFEEEAVSAKHQAAVARSRFMPTLGLGFNYSRFSEEPGKVYQDYDKNYNYSIGASVNWNLFNGFADKALVEQQKLNYKIAQENIIERRRILLAEIQQAFIEMQAWQEAAEINKDNLKSAEEELRLAEEKYRVGSGTLLDVTVAQSSVTNAKSTLVQAKYESMMAAIRLEAAMGILKYKTE